MRLTLSCVIRPGSAGEVPSGAQGAGKYAAAALRTRASAILRLVRRGWIEGNGRLEAIEPPRLAIAVFTDRQELSSNVI
jgi:hypothetical protein